MPRLEITADIIVHATEEIGKFLKPFNEIFNLGEESFTISYVKGHFDNPITLLKVQISKKQADDFLKKFLELLSSSQKKEIVEEIKERTENSNLYIRLAKQDFVQNRIKFNERESIRLKIHTPIYNKKDTVKVFSEIFQQVN